MKVLIRYWNVINTCSRYYTTWILESSTHAKKSMKGFQIFTEDLSIFIHVQSFPLPPFQSKYATHLPVSSSNMRIPRDQQSAERSWPWERETLNRIITQNRMVWSPIIRGRLRCSCIGDAYPVQNDLWGHILRSSTECPCLATWADSLSKTKVNL